MERTQKAGSRLIGIFMAGLNTPDNFVPLLVVSVLIFTASFWVAAWFDRRMRQKTKGQSWLDRGRRAFWQVGTGLPRELLKLWKILSIAWAMFAVWRTLSSRSEWLDLSDWGQCLDTRNPSFWMARCTPAFDFFMRFSHGRPHRRDDNSPGAWEFFLSG
jgi:hypothetical protein